MAPEQGGLPRQDIERSRSIGWRKPLVLGVVLSLLLLSLALLLGWREHRMRDEHAALRAELVAAAIEGRVRDRLAQLALELDRLADLADAAGDAPPQVSAEELRLDAVRELLLIHEDAPEPAADGGGELRAQLPPRSGSDALAGLQLLPPQQGAQTLTAVWDGHPGVRVAAAIDPEWFSEPLQGHGLEAGSVVNLVHASQRLYARSSENFAYLGRDLRAAALFSATHRARDHGRYDENSILGGEHRQFVYRRLSGTPLTVVVGTPMRAIAAPAWAFFGLTLVAAALLALLWLWLLRVFALAHDRQDRLLHELQRTTDKLRDTQALAGLAEFRWCVEAGEMQWSEAAFRLYGRPLSAGQPTVEEAFGYLHPDDVGRARVLADALIEGGGAVATEFRIRRDDGTLRWIAAHGEGVVEDGRMVLQGAQQDITALAVVRERLRMAQDIARIGDWEWDIASGEITWSDTIYAIYGLDPQHFRPHADNVFQFVHAQDRDELQRSARTLIETGERCDVEFRIVRPDGEIRELHAIGVRETIADGRTIVRSVQQDVTELAQVHERLRETEQQYRFLFEQNPLPMWVFDRETLAFLAVNEAMVEHYGHSRAELLGSSILDIRPSEDRVTVAAAARQQTDQRPQGQVWTHLRKDGSRLRMAIHTHDIEFAGHQARLVAAQDVTKREESEQRFQLVARATSDAIYDLDIASGALWWSDSFYTQFGYIREDVPPTLQAWKDLVHPDDLARIDASLGAAIEAPGVSEWEEEYRFRRHDGSHALVVDRGFFVRDKGGRALRMVGGMLDVSDKRRQDADLRLLRRAVEATESGILIADLRDPRIPAVYVNQGFQRMTGYDADEIIGRDSRFLDFDPRDLDTVRRIRCAIDARQELRTLVRIRRKDGSVFWNDFYMAPVIDEAGNVTHMVSVSMDVTERQRSEERFQLVARATSDAVWDWDIVNDLIWRSDNVHALFGYQPGAIAGSTVGWSALIHPDDRERVENSVRAALESDAAEWECEYRLRREDGGYADVFDRGFLQRDENGIAVRAVGGMVDVTQKHRDQADLRLLRRAVESTDNGIVIADARERDQPLVFVNAAFERITGYAAAEVLGRNCRFLQGGDRDQAALQGIRDALAEGREARAVLRNYRKDGSLFWNELHLAPVHDEGGAISHFVGIQSDVSHRHQYEQELAHRATHDQLTGLPNRQLLMDRLQQAILNADRYGRQAGVVFIDLDDFKLINDNLDHAAGDEALRMVAERLRKLVRETDTVGRFGGDEFVIVLTEQTDEDGVGGVIDRVSAALSAPMEIGGIVHTLTPSIGWCRYPEAGRDADTLLKHADMAMYQAKRQGRNRAVAYDPMFDTQASRRLQLVTQLRDALEREEFELVFQPLFDRDNRLVALEGLVRWRHPERGLLPPSEFIAVCEESGLIIELGLRTLREAARHHALLVAAGYGDVRIAVNVSALQFGYAFEDDVAAVMEEFRLPPGILELEITESVIMEHPERAIAAMQRIAALGVYLSVDDFGTGYSSLTYLRRLPIHRLKIDRSFVEDLPDDHEAASICASVIGLAHALGLKTVGEGVETEAQRQWLRTNGCDELQGYLLARPAPFDEILRLLATERSSSTA